MWSKIDFIFKGSQCIASFTLIDTSYNIRVKTGTKLLSGTDAAVYMILYSKTSVKSKNLRLVGSFERRDIDRFDFTVPDLGK